MPDRAFRLLSCFGPQTRLLPLAELSAQAGLPKPTALRLARTLVEWGALERTETGEYVIGLRLLEIASLAPRGHGLRADALPYMEDLHHATRQHVVLAVRDRHEAVVVEQLSARRAGPVTYRAGGRVPLRSSGVGLILLAFAPASVQEEVIDLDAQTGHELRARLAALRRDRYAVTSRTVPDAMTSVAVPIVDHRQTTIAAVSITTRSEHAEPATHIPAVVAVARAISRAL